MTGRGPGTGSAAPGSNADNDERLAARGSGRRNLLAAAVGTIVLLLIVGGVAGVYFAPSTSDVVPEKVTRVALDDDRDGIPDQDEVSGWSTQGGGEHQTDPKNPDTDGDGLTDGEEAGPSVETEAGEAIYAGWSDPTVVDTDSDGLADAIETGDVDSKARAQAKHYVVANPLVADSDGDGIGDGDEYFLDMNPLLTDSDVDGLVDGLELSFGSDPTDANPDGDSYADDEEFDRKSSPLSYDLTGDEKIEAGEGGLKFGDCDQCALDAGLRVEQIESVEYLAGHIASGVAVYGDFRDVALNIWKQKFIAAGVAVVGLMPFIGDSSKAVAILTKFGRRGDRAERAVIEVTEKLPLSESIKRKVLDQLPSRVGKLPYELAGGPKTYLVYKGEDYVGITKNFAVRQAQHARAGRDFTPEPIQGASNLSVGQARAIEQACIDQGGLQSSGGLLQNKINSISPTLEYKQDAVIFGLAFLAKVGGTCPVSSLR